MAFTGQFTGNVGRDPELKTTPNGSMVANFSVAVRQRKVNGEYPPARWVKVEVWGKPAEYVTDYVRRGDTVMVYGEVMQPELFTRRDGSQGVAEVLRANNVENFGRREDGGQRTQEQHQSAPAPAPAPAARPNRIQQLTQRVAPTVDHHAQELAQATGGQVVQGYSDIPF